MSKTDSSPATWRERPVVAALLRLVVFVLPILASILFINLATRVVPRPSGLGPVILWFVVLTAGVMAIVHVGDKVLRRFLPLIALFRLSLVFPDRAPSRFSMAMRRNTVRQLQRSIADGTLDEQTPQEAAEHLLMLAAALNDHDRLTRGHTERVRAYSLMIGEEMDLPKEDLARLHWAGLIHDVGKLEVPAEILCKDGRPTDEEWAILRDHPAKGDHLVAPLRPWLGQWADAASQHHERWDGNGYPNGLAAEEISLSGRIVAVADAYDVITSARSYKPPHTAEYGRQELAANAGSQFDPTVVRAFLSVGLGRLRMVMGPMSWLTQLPTIGQTPLAPALGTAATSAVAVIAASVAGLVGQPDTPVPAEAAPGVEFVAADFEAPDLSVATTEEAQASIDLALAYDNPETLRILSSGGTGTFTLNEDGTLVYVPGPDETGTVVAVIEACSVGVCRTPKVTVEISPVNDPPVAFDDVATGREDTPVLVDVLKNDEDVDSVDLSVSSVERIGGFVGDSAVVTPDGVRYTPAPNANGTVVLQYTVRDEQGGESTARIRIEIEPVNDAPVARDDVASTPSDAEKIVAVLANDSDVEGSPLRITAIADVTGGTAIHDGTSIRFTPDPAFSGAARARYTIVDSEGATATAWLTVHVGLASAVVSAVADVAIVAEDSSSLVDVMANDVATPASLVRLDGSTLAVTSPPARGTASPEAGKIRYVPDPDANGVDAFTYEICGTTGICDRAAVSLTITAVDDAPMATDDLLVIAEDAPRTSVDVAGNDLDVDGDLDPTTATLTTPPSLGTATVDPDGSIGYTPDPDANGNDAFMYRICDGAGLCDSAAVSVTITAVNDRPVAADDAAAMIAEDAAPVNIDVLANDTDVEGNLDPATISVVSAPTLGVAIVDTDNTIEYAPDPDENGVDSFAYEVCDTGGLCDTATVSITIAPVNDSPVAVDDNVAIDEDTPSVTVDVLANDTDVDPDTLTVSGFDASTVHNAAVTDLGGGNFSFAPEPDFFGSESFTYTVADGNGGTDVGTVTLEVQPLPDAPDAVDNAYAGDEDTDIVVAAPGLLGNDSDVDFETLVVDTTPVAPPSDGNVVLSADGSFTYTPDPGFVGVDSFTYRVTDPGALADTAMVTLTIDSGISAASFYFGDSGDASWDYDLLVAPPAASTPVFDSDADGKPGLSLDDTDEGLGETDPDKIQFWTLPASGGTLSLDGPIALQLWSTTNDYHDDHESQLYVWLDDCLLGVCTPLASTDLFVEEWNGGVADWVHHEVDLGSVTADIDPGHELRLRIQFDRHRMWVAMTADYPSAIDLTLANGAPVAIDDTPAAIPEDSPTVALDVLGNDIDANLDPSTVTVSVAPSLGTALEQADGTIDYTPTANLNGTDTFEYQICDTGGLCDTATVTVTITAVNDPPTFVGGGDINTTQGAQTFVAWATSISAGPPDESGQVLTWSGSYTNPGIFVTPPWIDASGTLTFETNAPGVSTFTARLTDDGGGTDTSADYVYTVTIS